MVNLRVLAYLYLKIKLESSANKIRIEELKTICKSFKNILKNKGPKTEPIYIHIHIYIYIYIYSS